MSFCDFEMQYLTENTSDETIAKNRLHNETYYKSKKKIECTGLLNKYT